MKIEIPKIVRVLPAGDYAAELAEVKIRVWVNPPRSLLARNDAAVADFSRLIESRSDDLTEMERVRREICEIFAEFWSAGPEETRWTAAEVAQLIEGLADTDPRLFPWLRQRTIEMIRAHREIAKKG